MTWALASSDLHLLIAVSAGNYTAGGLHLSARGLALAALAALILAGLYLTGCRIWPYGRCLACRANPRRNPGSTKRRFGHCRVCLGTGERLRVGSRLLLAWTNGRLPKGARR